MPDRLPITQAELREAIRDEARAVLGKCVAYPDGSQFCNINLPAGEEIASTNFVRERLNFRIL